MREADPVGPPDSEGTAPASPVDNGARQFLAENLLPEVYENLRRLASARLAKLGPGQAFQATSLVHEAYLKLVGDEDPGWLSKEHFFAAAAIAMRHILIDAARRRSSKKRGGDRMNLTFSSGMKPAEFGAVDVLDVEDVLARLEQHDPRKGRIVTLRFYGGLSIQQTALAMGLSRATVERDWQFARAWLHRELDGQGPVAGTEKEKS